MRYIGPARLALRAAAMALSAFLGSPPPVLGASFTVDATNDAVDVSPGDGVCEDAGGACTLRAAVMETNALPGADEISLPAGTYVLSIPGAGEDASATGDLDITGDLTMNGAGQDTTIIDGGGLDRVIHVLPAAISIVSAMTVRNGAALIGGGIENEGNLNLDRSTVVANTAESLPGCGGICPAPSGGGIGNLNSLRLTAILITGNRASVGGGLVNFESASLVLDLGSIADNTATSEGGAISNFADIEISDTSITDNEAGSTGGAIDNNVGNLRIVTSLLARNQAAYGGALYNQGVSSLTNATISTNSASISGGGILNVGATNTITADNLTVANNNSPTGGGIYNGSVDGLGEPGPFSVSNSLIAANGEGGDCSGPVTSLGHNLDSDGTCGLSGPGDLSGVGEEAGLVPLADNGGPTQTHALLLGGCQGDACVFGSIAIDAGDNSSCPATDQRGVLRPQDGDSRDGVICDIGAFEREGPPPVPCPAGQPCPSVGPVTPTPTSPPPTATPTLPLALPQTGGRPGHDGMSVVAVLATLPALLGATALSWRIARRQR